MLGDKLYLLLQIENLTREEIAKSRNINKDDIDPATCNAAVISGTELQELTTQELDWVLA